MSPHRNVTIIGSGPAGLTAALYAARANLKPLLIEGLEAGGQLMLTTMVENFPGFRDGIMGPELMADMRAQAERFGTEIIQGNVSEGRSQPPPVQARRQRLDDLHRNAHHCDGRIGAPAGSAIRARAARPRRVDLRDVRRIFLQGQADCGRRRRRLRAGRSASSSRSSRRRSRSCIGATRCARRRSCRTRRSRTRRSSSPGTAKWRTFSIRPKGVVTGIVLRDAVTGALTELPVEGVFVAIGHTPNTSLFTRPARDGRQRLPR